jgi:hypothetical protein
MIDRASQLTLKEPGPEARDRFVAVWLRLLNQEHPGRRYRLVTQRPVEDERLPGKRAA